MMNSKRASVSKDGTTRIRFASAGKRSKQASADVYRQYKRQRGVLSSATREERVHQQESSKKRPRVTDDGDVKQVVYSGKLEEESDVEGVETSSSHFSVELDLALDRNASEIFGHFHREIWHLVRSLPEILHHAGQVVDLLMAYVLSPESAADEKSPLPIERGRYVVNLATTDVLHLLAVLARDLRSEIHPFLHEKILPRVLNDLLNPPPPAPDSNKQPVPLEVEIIEAAFRSLAYVLRYDAEALLSEEEKEGKGACLEPMRKYYGMVLAHRRELVRRLAAETFAPFIRRLGDSAKRKHIRRVLRALATSASKQSSSPFARRLQADAADGIAQLLFEVVRGVKGRLHSKGHMVVSGLFGFISSDGGSAEIVIDVSALLLERLCHYLDASRAVSILREMTSVVKELYSSLSSLSRGQPNSLCGLLRLIQQMVSFRGGALFNDESSLLAADDITVVLEQMMESVDFKELHHSTQHSVVELLCAFWKVAPEPDDFACRISGRVQELVLASLSGKQGRVESAVSTASLLGEQLLPSLPMKQAMESVGSALLSLAAALVSTSFDDSVWLVHGVLMCTRRPDEERTDDDDLRYDLSRARFCSLSLSERRQLLQAFQIDISELTSAEESGCRFAALVQCVAFIVLVPTREETPSDRLPLYKQSVNWYLKLLRRAIEVDAVQTDGSLGTRQPVVFGLAIGVFSRLSLEMLELSDATDMLAFVKKLQPFVEKCLLMWPGSLIVTRGVAVFTEVLERLGLVLAIETDSLFSSLTPNLRSQSHFLRLHSLEILSRVPLKPFVTDHADLDLTEDLDEEPSSVAESTLFGVAKGPTGMCDVPRTLLVVESTSLSLSTERRLLSQLSRVEVLGRSGKLPVVYAEAAAAHMLGLFHVKFAPLWPAAVKTLAALTMGHEECAWPAIHSMISSLTTGDDVGTDEAKVQESTGNALFDREAPATVFRQFKEWEGSNGRSNGLFWEDIAFAREAGRVSRHETADDDTIFETAWSVVEEAPVLLARHSRTLVPIIIRFVHEQYFTADGNDPDARELRLHELVDVSKDCDNPTKPIRRRVQKRMVCVLKATAAVKGPHQLFKHDLLRSILVALIGHPDDTLSQLAFRCLLGFKEPHLAPYGDLVMKLFVKGKLRESILQFKAALDAGTISAEHRPLFIPIISRVLFGRLSARASRKSSNDSPTSRRTAVLSFLSILCISNDELYPFVYLMMRAYLPPTTMPAPVECQKRPERANVLKSWSHLKPDDLSGTAVAVHQGFLNMLRAVVAQLGLRVEEFVPSFVHILVVLLTRYQVKDSAKYIVLTEAEGKDDDDDDDVAYVADLSIRSTTIRSLCFQRLSEILEVYHDVVDFGPWVEELWKSAERSVQMLPEMVVNSEHVPALLSMLVTISRHPPLHCYLQHHEPTVTAVLGCITSQTGRKVVETSLDFVGNLLGDERGGGSCDIGVSMIAKHLGLLLRQFRSRLDAYSAQGGSLVNPLGSNVWKRELDILCRVSELLHSADDVGVAVVESLCDLLLPFLDHVRVGEIERVNVANILNSLLPRVSAESAASLYNRLGRLLGPSRGKPGLRSKQLRQLVAKCVLSLASACLTQAVGVARVLQDLCAVEAKRVDEIDYDVVVPAFARLGDDEMTSGWIPLCTNYSNCDPSLLVPLVHCSFHFLYDEDGVLARSALRAVKTLIGISAAGCDVSHEHSSPDIERGRKWSKLLEGCIVPITRNGLGAKYPSVRRFFVLVMRDICIHCRAVASPHLHGDLARFTNEDELDLDFFLNLTHVQLHRRARAFQKLRRALPANDGDADDGEAKLSAQSLSNVLLPLSLHPIYESKSKAEESLAVEAIATVGAITRLVSWSKYSNVLMTTLNQFPRHPEQERYLVGLLCAVIDSFHFDIGQDGLRRDLEETGPAPEGSTNTGGVWRALDKRIIPGVEKLLVKDDTGKAGERSKTLRPAVALALLKLYQKLPMEYFHSKLPRLLAVVCDVLKGRESNARDTARSTLAKMACEMDVAYLADVVRELAITLTEGYQLHVRSATLHSILLELSAVYVPPDSSNAPSSPFDLSVPGLMDLLQQDLFGGAQERKDARDSQVRYVKEAAGSKSYHSLELVASMILFKHEATAGSHFTPTASVFALVSPFLERLRDPNVSAASIRRIRECLSRVVSGLSRNQSTQIGEVLVFVRATVEPYIGRQEVLNVMDSLEGDDSDSDDELKPITVSGTKGAPKLDSFGQPARKVNVSEWRPSTLGAAATTEAARRAKTKDERNMTKVSTVPKLTGSHRLNTKTTSTVNNPSSVSAVIFGLQLLQSSLRKAKPERIEELTSQLDPFVPLLATCICVCRELDVVLLALKSLGILLRLDLPSLSSCTRSLASKTLELLTSTGSTSNQNQEIINASFKTLSYLMDFDRSRKGLSQSKIPLSTDQMQVLLSFLKGSIVDAEQHTPAIGLVKSIMSRRYTSAELYDLMEVLLEQTASSLKPSLRQQSASVFMIYLLNYPLSEERIEQHMKQIVLNLQYEQVDGRLSATNLLGTVIEKVPLPVVDQFAKLFFLPLTLQLANDSSKACREAAAKNMASLLRRLSPELKESLFEYALRWAKGTPDLRRAAMQVLGIFVESDPEFIRRRGHSATLATLAQKFLVDESGGWELQYFALLFLEKAMASFGSSLATQTEIWRAVAKSPRASHPWTRTVACRLLWAHFSSLDLAALQRCDTYLVVAPGSLFETARSLCHVISVEEEEQNDDLVGLAVKALSWILQAMSRYPELCFKDDSDKDKDPVRWLMTRLSNTAKPKGTKRRQAVYKCFAAFATVAIDVVQDHLELILEPLHRSQVEARNEIDVMLGKERADNAIASEESQLAMDVLHLIEEQCGGQSRFLEAYAAVKNRAREKKEKRKTESKTIEVIDPQAAAKQRIQKQEREKKRRKRRVEDRRRDRGGDAKRRHID